jgi:hypothetical protein
MAYMIHPTSHLVSIGVTPNVCFLPECTPANELLAQIFRAGCLDNDMLNLVRNIQGVTILLHIWKIASTQFVLDTPYDFQGFSFNASSCTFPLTTSKRLAAS